MLSQLLVVFGFFSLVLVAVYWVNSAVRLFDRLISDGQSAAIFLEFTALSLPTIIANVLPISAFVATVFVLSRLARESELVVMQAAGGSPWRLVRPVLWFSLVVAAFLSVVVHVLEPASRGQLAERNAQIAQNIGARLLTEGSFLHPGDGITLFIREITADGELRDVFLSDNREGRGRTDYTARTALLLPAAEGPKLVMLDGLAQGMGGDGRRLSLTGFDEITYDLAPLIGGGGPDLQLRELSTPTLLRAAPETLSEIGASRAEALQEGYDRLAHPLLAVVTAVIGGAALLLGGFSRTGHWRQILGAITVMAIIQMLNNFGAGLALRDAAYAPLSFLPVALGALTAAGMLWWAGRRKRGLGWRGPPARTSGEVPA